MPDYQQGKIYCIRSHQTDEIYIGSTTKKYLSQRLAGHKSDYTKYLKGKQIYVSSFKLLEYDDAYIELISDYPCNSKAELNREEGKYHREMDCVNKRIAGRTQKEYDDDNKEKKRDFYKENREVLNQKAKQNYQDNKEHVKEYGKQYRERNKEKLTEKFACECGGKYLYTGKAYHFKTKKHKKYIDETKQDDISS